MTTATTETGTVEAAPAPLAHHHPVYSRGGRVVAALLLTASAASLPAMLVLVVSATDPPVTPPILARLFAVFAVLPYVAGRLLRRAMVAEIELRPSELVVRRRGLGLEIPYGAIERVVPWTAPLPGPGFGFVLRSGRRLHYGVEAEDPTPLLAALGDAGGVGSARRALEYPTLLYARTWSAARHRRRWYHLLAKFPVFGLVPTAVLFNAHQHIAHGGLLGEYYLLGLASYLRTFAIYWGTLSIYLVLYAGVWRGLAEAVALIDARVAPARAAATRRIVERVCGIAYFAGVPVLLLLRFLP